VSFIVNPEKSLENLYQHSEIDDIYRKNNRVYVQAGNTDKVLELLFQEKIGAHDIQIERGKLEEAFEQLTGENKEAI
jgi:ABC-2 type transport system ATP-binding protein